MKPQPDEKPLFEFDYHDASQEPSPQLRVQQFPVQEEDPRVPEGVTRISLGGKMEIGHYLTLRGDPKEALRICQLAVKALERFEAAKKAAGA